MPLMTNPLAHVEMVLEEVKGQIRELYDERMKIEAKLDVLNHYRYKIDKALDEEKLKLAPSGDSL